MSESKKSFSGDTEYILISHPYNFKFLWVTFIHFKNFNDEKMLNFTLEGIHLPYVPY